MIAKIKNTTKNLTVLGVALLGLAVTTQSFDNKEDVEEKADAKKSAVLAPNFLVNKGASFSPRNTVNPSLNCNQTDSKNCTYQITAEGMENVPEQESYTPTQIEEYESNGWIEPHAQSGLALYQN
ncbi:hypothetical protein [Sphingobacterium pedocola]|uniref:Uncharacterized protein n=1 Tax=Sphingobacterium pedocola TaxID=2082722 RepID=A0ABR9T369_9SPHI|nr:hypothetical protein [Sphingobacterium pedocola]MBE8719781.1 hypothetical protein [Sphingobacterium pedocola]